MANIFAITTPAEDMKADAAGKASAIFTVTNTSHKPVRGIARARALGNTENDWLDVEGETERDFGAGATEQFTVNFSKSADAPAGKFPFRLDVASATNPDEEFTEGPTVNVQTAPQAQLIKKAGFPWWIIPVIALLLLLIAGAVWFLVFRTDGNQPDSASAANARKRNAAGNFAGTWVNDKVSKKAPIAKIVIQPDGDLFEVTLADGITDGNFALGSFRDSNSLGPFKSGVDPNGTWQAKNAKEGKVTIVTLRLMDQDRLSLNLALSRPRQGGDGAETVTFNQNLTRSTADKDEQPTPTPPAAAAANNNIQPAPAVNPAPGVAGRWEGQGTAAGNCVIRRDGDSYTLQCDGGRVYRGTVAADGTGTFSLTDSEGSTTITIEWSGGDTLFAHWVTDRPDDIPRVRTRDVRYSRMKPR